MFFGRYDYTIDAKGRLNFPAKFRDAMGESFVVLEWVDSCLFALPMEEVQRLADKLESDELMDSWAISGDLFSTACDTLEIMEGNTGTNAWTMQIVGRGIAMGLLSIPEKYMHTPVEVVKLSDVQAVADLMAEFLRGFDGEVGA